MFVSSGELPHCRWLWESRAPVFSQGVSGDRAASNMRTDFQSDRDHELSSGQTTPVGLRIRLPGLHGLGWRDTVTLQSPSSEGSACKTQNRPDTEATPTKTECTAPRLLQQRQTKELSKTKTFLVWLLLCLAAYPAVGSQAAEALYSQQLKEPHMATKVAHFPVDLQADDIEGLTNGLSQEPENLRRSRQDPLTTTDHSRQVPMADKISGDITMTHEGPQRVDMTNCRAQVVQGAVSAPKRQRTLLECYAAAKPRSADLPAVLNRMCEGSQEQYSPEVPRAEFPQEHIAITLSYR